MRCALARTLPVSGSRLALRNWVSQMDASIARRFPAKVSIEIRRPVGSNSCQSPFTPMIPFLVFDDPVNVERSNLAASTFSGGYFLCLRRR